MHCVEFPTVSFAFDAFEQIFTQTLMVLDSLPGDKVDELIPLRQGSHHRATPQDPKPQLWYAMTLK